MTPLENLKEMIERILENKPETYDEYMDLNDEYTEDCIWCDAHGKTFCYGCPIEKLERRFECECGERLARIALNEDVDDFLKEVLNEIQTKLKLADLYKGNAPKNQERKVD